MLSLLLLSAACSVTLAWPQITFNPPLSSEPELHEYTDGMNAWKHIPGSQYVDIPDWMTGGEHKAWILSESLASETTITITCPDVEDACDVYVYVYHCPPCALHGGLPAALLSSGWVSGSCAPFFTLKPGGDRHKMAIFRKQLAKGEQVRFTTTMEGRYVGFGSTPYGVSCGSSTYGFECSSKRHCMWENNQCVDHWCPRRFNRYNPPPPVCTVCAGDNYYGVPPSTPEPPTYVAPTPLPPTYVAPTPAPLTPAPRTPVPPTYVAPTPAPLTPAPPTPEPPTYVAPTPEPPTYVAPTPAPLTPAPPTPEPPTYVAPTPEPPTYVAPTPAPPVYVAPTPVPYRDPSHSIDAGKSMTAVAYVIRCEDDMEERMTGQVSMGSRDLELTYDYVDQMVGVRWAEVNVPKGAVIVDAHVVFEADVTKTSDTAVSVAMDYTSHARPWHVVRPSGRTTTPPVEWQIKDPWMVGRTYKTPSLTEMVQTIIDLPDWESGKAMAAVFKPGTTPGMNGWRRAVSCEGVGEAPVLKVSYIMSTPSAPPSIPRAPPRFIGECGPRMRKAYSSMDCKERQDFVDAVKTLKATDPATYDKFVDTHERATRYAHSTSAFLPWHRWYLVQFENALRKLPGHRCITIPFWDWEKDDTDEYMSAPLKHTTFGDFVNHSPADLKCVNSGIAKGWIASDGVCLRRANGGANEYGFTGEAQMAALISSYHTFADFAPRLEAAPHAAPHSFIGGHMSSMRSPDDPLFWIHHANVDRMWALWQDYHGHDAVSSEDLASVHYRPLATGGSAGMSLVRLGMDTRMEFPSSAEGAPMPAFENVPTFRQVNNIMSLPEGNSYTYGHDCLAMQLGEPLSGEWDVAMPACPGRKYCCGDGTTDPGEECDDGNKVNGDGCSATCRREGTSGRTAEAEASDEPGGDDLWYTPGVRFSDDRLNTQLEELEQSHPTLPKNEILCMLARKSCKWRGNKPAAGEAWVSQMGYEGINRKYLEACGYLPEE